MHNVYIFLIVGAIIFHKFIYKISVIIYLMIKYHTLSLTTIEKELRLELEILKLENEILVLFKKRLKEETR